MNPRIFGGDSNAFKQWQSTIYSFGNRRTIVC